MGILRFALKSTVAGSVVYYSVQEGLWSKPEDTLKMYCKMYNTVAPYIQKNIPEDFAKEVSDLPSVSTLSNCARGMWNQGVISSVKFVSELPMHISNGIDYLTSVPAVKDSVTNVKGLFDAPPEIKKN